MLYYQHLKGVLFSLLICISFVLLGQKKKDNIELQIIPKFGVAHFILGKQYPINSDSIQLETIKFYISNIELLLDGKATYKEKNSYHLVDFLDTNSMSISLIKSSNEKFNEIKFNIGIDSIINQSGAFGGDLDPTKGMYWTWQNGYINIKLEGSISNSITDVDSKFEYHLGGYQYPTNTIQQMNFDVKQNSNVDFVLDVEKMIQHIDVEKQPKLMSPSAEAVDFATNFSRAFIAPKLK